MEPGAKLQRKPESMARLSPLVNSGLIVVNNGYYIMVNWLVVSTYPSEK